MKELKDTVELMLSDDWQDRLKAEIYQCQIRREALSKFMLRINKDDPEFEMLNSQLVHMIDYECDLTNRASAFGIELESIDRKSTCDPMADCCCCPNPNTTPDPFLDPHIAFLLGAVFGMDLNKDGDKK